MDAINLIDTWGYAVVIAGTLLDHTGVPLFIVAAGVILASGCADPLLMGIAIMFSIELTDGVLMLAGRYFQHRQLADGYFSRLLAHILAVASDMIRDRPLVVFGASKWIPGIGKYAPFVSAYTTDRPILSLMGMYLPGNIVYAAVWLIAGIVGGHSVIGNARSISAALLGVIVIIYLVANMIFFRRKRVKKSVCRLKIRSTGHNEGEFLNE
jgi:membrane protein DedA with SNARE-associated domain